MFPAALATSKLHNLPNNAWYGTRRYGKMPGLKGVFLTRDRVWRQIDAMQEHPATKSEGIRLYELALANECTELSKEKGRNFKPWADDIILSTTPKSGTTMTLQILHSLRSRGDMTFDEIMHTVPNIEAGHDFGFDLDAPQPYHPRLIWTHLWRTHLAGAGKYIYVTRDPLDAGPSFYYYMAGWFFNPKEITLEQFLEEWFLALGSPRLDAVYQWYDISMWHHQADWFAHRLDSNVLWLHYEDLVEDRAACIKLIADFIEVGHDDPQLQALAFNQSDIEFMKQHPEKYDDHFLKQSRNEAMGLLPDAGTGPDAVGKVREGKIGKNKEKLSPKLREAFQKKWQEIMLPATGFSTYREMRDSINRELGRPFKYSP